MFPSKGLPSYLFGFNVPMCIFFVSLISVGDLQQVIHKVIIFLLEVLVKVFLFLFFNEFTRCNSRFFVF